MAGAEDTAGHVNVDTARVYPREIPWDLYVRLRGAEANRHVRMAYFRGVLELLSPR